MTKPAKRSFDAIDYRPKSPKRRKVDRYTVPDDSSEPDEIWSVRAILKEKKHGRGTKYLLDWAPNSVTGETYEPTWEPASNVADDLIENWERQKEAKSSDRTYRQTQPDTSATTSTTSSPAQKARTSLKLRLKYRPDPSSSTESPTQADAHPSPYTPSLASPAESSAEDDADPPSPSLEILETQNQSSLSSRPARPVSPTSFSVQIPTAVFDKADYQSYKGSSQLASSLSSPAQLERASPPARADTGTPIAKPPTQDSPLPLSSQSLGSVRRRKTITQHSPLQDFTSSAPPDNRIEIPASLHVEEAPDTTASTQAPATSAVKESSSDRPLDFAVLSAQPPRIGSSQSTNPRSPQSSSRRSIQPVASSAPPSGLGVSQVPSAASPNSSPVPKYVDSSQYEATPSRKPSSRRTAEPVSSTRQASYLPSSWVLEGSSTESSLSQRIQHRIPVAQPAPLESSDPTKASPSKPSCAPATSGSQRPGSIRPEPATATSSAESTSQSLKPLELPSSPSDFISQLPEIRRRLASPVRISTKPRAQSPLHKSSSFTDARNKSHSTQRDHETTPTKPAVKMDAPTVRQSPRLQTATPVAQSRSPAPVTQQSRRARTPQTFEEANSQAVGPNVTSPLATNPPHIADYSSQPSNAYSASQAYQDDAPMSVAPYATVYDPAVGVSALPIQQSIEEEHQSSADSIASKASSSQVSLQNERIIPQIDGISLPTEPVIGPAEYVVGLPAEGKIQSIYTDLINAKKKLILKFIHRRDSVGSAQGSTSRTLERNEMIDLMERLQDTTTHMDLGLPGFTTQYSIQSQEAAAYARYAGSKFGFLGDLLDTMKRVDCGLVIACKPGAVQDLVTDFIKLKHVLVRRHDRPASARATVPDTSQEPLQVDIISTDAGTDIHLSAKPVLMIAFDASFDNQNAQIRRLRELHSKGRDQLLPVVHLLVTNSSEHIDRCMRKAMPSPQRLKLLVRGTYLARDYLGGSPSYIPPPPNPDGSPANEVLNNMHDLQRAVRKSPARKLTSIAATLVCAALSADFEENWNINTLPQVQYDELEDTPPKISETTTAAGTAAPTPRDGRMRTRSPASRSNTPSGRKRLLDVDAAATILAKRQRLTPTRDVTPVAEPSREGLHIEQLQEKLKTLAIDLANEKDARARAEESRDIAIEKLAQSEKNLQQWKSDHAGLLRRYEKQRDHNRTLDKENKRLKSSSESVKLQNEKVRETNSKVQRENVSLKQQLESARNDLKAEGGDIGALEEARSEARISTEKVAVLEKSLKNNKQDFEFTRQKYMEASASATELARQNNELEAKVEELKQKASGEQRLLKEMNENERSRRDRDEVEKLSQEQRAMLIMMRKLDEENKMLKKTRGVQTRGSSAQPPSSPGIAGFGRRSRQNSPAVGAREDRLTVPSSSGNTRDRVNAVRNEP